MAELPQLRRQDSRPNGGGVVGSETKRRKERLRWMLGRGVPPNIPVHAGDCRDPGPEDAGTLPVQHNRTCGSQCAQPPARSWDSLAANPEVARVLGARPLPGGNVPSLWCWHSASPLLGRLYGGSQARSTFQGAEAFAMKPCDLPALGHRIGRFTRATDRRNSVSASISEPIPPLSVSARVRCWAARCYADPS